MDKRIVLALGLWLMASLSFAQKIETKGIFLADSVKIGEVIHYSLTAKYPADWQVIFPDSTFDYAPFEFYSKQYFASTKDSLIITDSVVYSLATFEIDPVQKLALPIFILDKADSIAIASDTVAVFLVEMIKDLPDSVKYRTDLSYLPVHYAVNYPYIAIGVGVFLLICILVMVFFGKKIRARIRLYRLKKDYEKFSKNFENGINNIRSSEHNKELIEEILVIWKKYMERIENRPFTKYTSKEIVKAGYEPALGEVLKNIDRAIYGNMSDDQMHKNFESLEDMTLQRYQLKIKEVLNG